MHGYKKVPVEIENIYNAVDIPIPGNDLHSGIDGPNGYRVLDSINTWLFQERFLQSKIHKNLVVIWRTSFVRTKFPGFKASYDDAYWDLIIPLLKMQGYTVIDVDYRTPIREVFYLISACEFVVAYNGMYGYLAKNLVKPSIILGNSGILKTHNPQAVNFFSPAKDPTERYLLDYILNIKSNLIAMKNRVKQVKTKIYPIVYGKDYET